MAETTHINDGYVNAVTGMATMEMDKTAHTRALPYTSADLKELARMQMQDGLADTIVSAPPKVSFQNDPTISGDGDGKIFEGAVESGLIEAIQVAGEEMRLTGGAIVVSEYEEENEVLLMEEPKDNWTVSGYRVYSSAEIRMDVDDFEGDSPKWFRVITMDGSEVKVHPSRCTVFKGKRLAGALKLNGVMQEKFFGTSVLKPVEKELKNLATVTTSVVNMASETGTLMVSLKGLNDMLMKENGQAQIHQLISTMKLCMNSMRATFAGEEDKFSILSHNFSGLPEILKNMMVLISAKSNFPMSILFGQTATGLSQTNEGDIKAYAGMVESWRKRYLYKPAASLIKDYARRNHSVDVEGFTWGSIDVRTLTEELEARERANKIDMAEINAGVITPDEVREARHVNGYSYEMPLNK